MGKWCSRYYTLEKTWPFPPLRFASVLAWFYSFIAFLRCSGRSSAGGAVGLLHAVQGSCHLPTHAQEAAAHGRWPSASPLPRDSGLSPPSPTEQPVPFAQHPLRSVSLAGGKCLISYSSAQNFSVSVDDKIPQDSLQNSWGKENTNLHRHILRRHRKKGNGEATPSPRDQHNFGSVINETYLSLQR